MPAFIWHIDGAAVILIGSLQTFKKPQAVAYLDKFSQIAGEGTWSLSGREKWVYGVFWKFKKGNFLLAIGWTWAF